MKSFKKKNVSNSAFWCIYNKEISQWYRKKIGTYSIVLFVPQTIRHWFHDTKFINLEYDRTKVYGGAGGGGAVRVKSANL